MKKTWIAVFLCALLAGCSPVSLSDRAIVKAIFLDETQEGYQAAIAVFSCEPTTDAASAEGQAHLYLGRGEDVAQALADAERQQTKTPFYAQNELLLLGKGCMTGDPTGVLDYFGEEDSSRKDMAVYLVPMDADEFMKCEDGISRVIHETESIASANGAKGVFGTHETNCAGGFSGLLPVLDFSEDGSAFAVDRAVLFTRGAPTASLCGAEYQLALILLGKSGEMTFDTQSDSGRLDVSIKGASVRKNAVETDGGPALQLAMTGTITSLTRNGRLLYAGQSDQPVRAVDERIAEAFHSIADCTFAESNDLFGFTWWMRSLNSRSVDALQESGELYRYERLLFSCNMRYS